MNTHNNENDNFENEGSEMGFECLVKEFEKEGMKLNSKRISLSNSSNNSLVNTPLNSSPPMLSYIEQQINQQQQQQQQQQQTNQVNNNILSISNNNLVPQLSPFILGYAREDMSKDDELAIIPSYLMPLHPFASYKSLNVLLSLFKNSTFYPTNNNNTTTNINNNNMTSSLNDIIDHKLLITEQLSKVITDFINNNKNTFTNLSLSIDDFVMLLFLVSDYYSTSIIDPLNNTKTSLKKSTGISNSGSSSSSSSSSSSNLSNLSYFEIINNLINISTPITSNFNNEEFQTILEFKSNNDSSSSSNSINNKTRNSNNLNIDQNYMDLSFEFNKLKNDLKLIFTWVLKFIGFKVYELQDREPTENQITNSRIKSINKLNLIKLESCLFKSFNYIKVASIVNVTLPNITFKSFLPLPHYLIQSNIYKQTKIVSSSTNSTTPTSLTTSPTPNKVNNNNLFLKSLENDDDSFSELVAVLNIGLYKDSPIQLEDIEIITLSEFKKRSEPQQQQQQSQQQHPLIKTKQYNSSNNSLLKFRDINNSFDDSSIFDIDNYQLDLYSNEELLLYYGYTSLEEEMGSINFEIQVYKSITELQSLFSGDELEREIKLMNVKKSILNNYLGQQQKQQQQAQQAQKNELNSSSIIASSTSSFKKQPTTTTTTTGNNNSTNSLFKEGYYLDYLSQENLLGFNLLELTRLSKLREGESYFYEDDQLSTMINNRNEMESLVYLFKQLRSVLIKITDKLNLISKLMVSNKINRVPSLIATTSTSSIMISNNLLNELEKYYKSHLSIIEQSIILVSNLKHQFTKPTIKSVPFIKPTDEVYRRLDNWLKAGGVSFPKLQIANFTDSTGRGVVTSKKVDENETVVSVPRKYLINVDVAKAHPILGPIFEELHINDDTILFLFVIYEKENPNTFWRPFYDTLPSYFTTSINYSATELLELEGTNLFEETLNSKQHLSSFRDYLFPELSKQYPEHFPESVFSWENFLWARSLLDSRAIQLKIDGKIKSCLVPMADMINHHTNAQISERFFDSDQQCFKMISSVNIPANNQIFLHYGALQNWELALYYGFIIPNNIYDSLHIGYELEDDDQDNEEDAQDEEADDDLSADREIQIDEETGEEILTKREKKELKEAKDKLLAKHNLVADSHFLRKDRIPSKNFACLRVILLTKKEFNPFIDIWNTINLRNESAVLQTLYQLVLLLLKSFSSTFIEDQHLLDSMNDNDNNNSLENNNNSKIKDDEDGDHDDDDDDDDDDDSSNSEINLQSTEQMKMVLQYRIEQKQILSSTIDKIVSLMNEIGLEPPQSPESTFIGDDDDGYSDDQSNSSQDEYFSDTNEDEN